MEEQIKKIIAELECLRVDARDKSLFSGLSNSEFGSYCGQEHAYKTAIIKLEQLRLCELIKGDQ